MPRKFRLAAIDIDGTLIHNPSLIISEANRNAIARMQDAGIEIALASGRHHASMLPFVAQLSGLRWMVSSQGCEVSDISRREVLEKVFIPASVAQQAITLGRSLGYAIAVYADDGIYRLDAPEKIEAYAGLDGGKITEITDAQALEKPLLKVMWTGDENSMTGIETMPELATLDATHVRTHTYLYEFLPSGVTKGTGVARLAAHLGISADETIAFGDAENDIPLFQWAGFSVAMPSRWPAARAAATITAPDGPPETAFARSVEKAVDFS
ncbi:Cof-type HAD-IIB family hydrolase [Ereboglobus luteus]|uniref:Haloacid dehalogenase n=1 Tax=Ereboglobus luteus TaxID=1796921 RepID=A0A2U8E4R7_9BACT|nr:Cof-type HAD-IIB family hydrolase [Ereboglobus luteus]AWI09857.1 hypothetical protein CKA38_11900 [Ereboglobus luteus]